MIVVDGPDLCGKTSLASALCYRLALPVLTFDGDVRSVDVQRELRLRPDPFIADRFCLSALVAYPGSRFPAALEDEMIRRHAVLVYLHDHPAAIVDRILRLGRSRVGPNDVSVVIDRYEAQYAAARTAKLRERWSMDIQEQKRIVDRIAGLVGA